MKITQQMYVYLDVSIPNRGQLLLTPFKFADDVCDLCRYVLLGSTQATAEIDVDLEDIDMDAEFEACRERYEQYKKEQAA